MKLYRATITATAYVLAENEGEVRDFLLEHGEEAVFHDNLAAAPIVLADPGEAQAPPIGWHPSDFVYACDGPDDEPLVTLRQALGKYAGRVRT